MRIQDLPGRHVTDSEMRIYMKFHAGASCRKKPTSAPRAATGLRGTSVFRSESKSNAGDAAPIRRAAVWESEIVPMLQAAPGRRVVAVFEEIRRRHPRFASDLESDDA
jgi:hypothetical protein